MSTEASIRIFTGEDVVVRVNVVDQDGAIKDVSAGTISFRMGDMRAPTLHFIKAGGFVTDGTDGAIYVDILKTESAGFTVDTYDYQFIVTDFDGDVQVVQFGSAEILQMLPAS